MTMHDGMAGYVGDVAYPDHFQRELMPVWLHAVTTALGFVPPDISRPYRWCELGCGGGLSAMVAAACNPLGDFTAIDIDATQMQRACAMAETSGVGNVRFIAADLCDYAVSPEDDGKPFDFIVLHGLWAWVGDEVRDAVLSIIRHRLAPGGLVQIGYMSHPGASQMQAVHKLMREAARHAEGDSGQRAATALGLLRQLAEGGAGYFAEHPGAMRQLDAMERETPEYLAHEFLGANWEPQYVADVIRMLAGTGCAYVGSATPLENIDALSVPGALQPLLRAMPPGPLAETVRDMARNQSQRRDIFQRGARPSSVEGHFAALDALVFAALPGAPSAVSGDMRFDTRIGPIEVPRDWLAPVLGALASGPQSFASLRRLPPFHEAPGLLNQVLQLLTWAGQVHPLRADNAGVSITSTAFPLPSPFHLSPSMGTAIPVQGTT